MGKGGSIILTYHHIADPECDPGVLSVSPRRFAEHLEVIRKDARPLPLEEIANFPNEVSDRAVAITLDDGYADNLIQAKPLLERYEIPATVFIAGAGEGEPEFWWDELERLLLRPGELPRSLLLPVGDERVAFDLNAAAVYTSEAFRRDSGWKVWEDPPTPRHALFQRLCPILQTMRPEARDETMRALRALPAPRDGGIPEHRRMTAPEIASLAAGGLIGVGSHTVTHSSLPALSPAEQRDEIRRNRSHLEEISRTPVRGFSYPYGSFSAETEAVVREEGFDFACSTETGNVQPSSGRFRLPRRCVFDLDGDGFARWLREEWNGAGAS